MRKVFLDGTRIEDLRGIKFGKLTVIEFDYDKFNNFVTLNKNKSRIRPWWVCECECGKLISISGARLKLEKINSCCCGVFGSISESRKSCFKLSFEQWCLDNNHQDWLDLWDYELNEKSPNEVGSRSGGLYYFKCRQGIHKSGSFRICKLTEIKSNGVSHTSVSCKTCNSFGYWLEKNGIIDLWSKSNTIDPFDIPAMWNNKVVLICKDCGTEKSISCNQFVFRKTLSCICSSGQSYPNKMIYALLTQVGVVFDSEKRFVWSKNKRYDNYIPSAMCLIENHGIQHYDGRFSEFIRDKRTLEEEQSNDKLKRKLALNNGIKYYIELDCRYSELEWIKKSVMTSELPQILGFKEEDIDWMECEKFALSNRIKEVCDLWMTRKFKSTVDLGLYVDLDRTSIISYLKRGNTYGWCDYCSKDEMIKNAKTNGYKMGKSSGKPIYVIKEDVIVGEFLSCSDLCRNCEDLFGVNMCRKEVGRVCSGKRVSYKGYTFKYID